MEAARDRLAGVTVKSGVGRERGGFSLVELLVVVAILGVLGGILVPVMGRVRGQARTAAEVAAGREVVRAYLLEADASRGRLLGSPTYQDALAADLRDFEGQPVAAGNPAASSYLYWLYPYADRDVRAFFVNDGEELLGAMRSAGYGSYPICLFPSFGLNVMNLGRAAAGAGKAERIEQVPRPASFLVFASSAFGAPAALPGVSTTAAYAGFYRLLPPAAAGGTWSAGDVDAAWPSASGYVHFRHAGRAVAAWLDGHVSLEAPAALALPEKWSVAGQRPGGVVP